MTTGFSLRDFLNSIIGRCHDGMRWSEKGNIQETMRCLSEIVFYSEQLLKFSDASLLREIEKEPKEGPENPEKPPLGLMPKQIWLEQRAMDLVAAMARYSPHGRWDKVLEWSNELEWIIGAFNPGRRV